MWIESPNLELKSNGFSAANARLGSRYEPIVSSDADFWKSFFLGNTNLTVLSLPYRKRPRNRMRQEKVVFFEETE